MAGASDVALENFTRVGDSAQQPEINGKMEVFESVVVAICERGGQDT